MPTSDRPPLISLRSAASWQEIDELLHEISALSRSPQAKSEFAETVCKQVRNSLTLASCRIWAGNAEKGWKLVAQSPGDDRIPTLPGQAFPGARINVAEYRVDGGIEGVVEFVASADAIENSQVLDGVVEAIAELVGDHFQHQRLKELREGDQSWRRLSDLAIRIHERLDPEITAFRIANEGREWLGCDRLSVLLVKAGSPQLTAMSGVDQIERRAALVRNLESLCAAVTSTAEPLWVDHSAVELPPEIDRPLHEFLEHSPARVLGVIPLNSTLLTGAESTARGANALLVVEAFDLRSTAAQLRDRVNLLAPHAVTALQNATQHQRVPFAAWFDRLASLDHRLLRSRAAIAAGAVIVAGLMLAFIPSDFKVEARGELQPKVRHEVFSPADAVISDVAVRHGQTVQSGEKLVSLKRAELDLELARVNGELATARKKLAAIQALKIESPRGRDVSPERAHQLTAEEEELKELIRGLERQLHILAVQQDDLVVKSRLAGKVLTWNVEPLLAARPVARGQHLLTVADDKGAWELNLEIPDDRMGYVLRAQQDQSQPLPVSFVVATDPAQEYDGRLDRVSQIAETDAEGRSTVAATVELPPEFLAGPRPGAEVIAHIDCGRRSLGYVWFHDVIDALRSWLSY